MLAQAAADGLPNYDGLLLIPAFGSGEKRIFASLAPQ